MSLIMIILIITSFFTQPLTDYFKNDFNDNNFFSEKAGLF